MGEGVVGKAWDGNRANFDRNLAVVIGIDRYKNHPSIRNLSTAASDAKAIAKLLQEKYAYQASDMICRFDEQATLDELTTLFDTRIREELNPGEGDRLIIYFAGHGLPRSNEDGPEGYLVPHDADPAKPELFLAMRDVYKALESLECHHLLVILDCCFAGTFRWAGSRKALPLLETIHQEHYYHFIRHPAWQVITSSAHDQEALDVARLKEDNRQPVANESGSLFANELHSPFALALLEGLHPEDGSQRVRADLIHDGVVTAHELFVYLQTRVKQLSGKRQAPGIYPLRREYDKGEFVFTPPEFNPDVDLAKALPLNEENNPYRGLKSFDEKHADFFFGRQALTGELAKRLAQPDQALIVVLGVSGSGKSSLVKAGLLPHLRAQKTQQETNLWRILEPMRPGEAPFVSLARTLLPIADESLLKQLAEVSFLDTVLQPDTESDRASVDETPRKVAVSWCSAKPEAKLLLIEDYYAQLEPLGNSQQREQLKNLYDQILEKLGSVSQQLQDEPKYFSQLIATWHQNHPGMRLLLVIDQFEELLTRSQDDRESANQTEQKGVHAVSLKENHPTVQKEWQKFLESLRIAIENHSQTLRLVLTLRSDFEPRFLSSALEPYWKDARFPVRAMNSDELRQAIENPALKQALYFEELKDEKGNTIGNLVSKLVDEVGQMPGALPLLSFTLSELYVRLYKRWENPTYTGRTLLFEDYESLSGVAGALTRRATEEHDKLIQDKDIKDEFQGGFGKEEGKLYQATMRRVMLRMVAIEGGGIARRRVPKLELLYPSNGENQRVEVVIDRLVKARLLVKGQEIGESYVEPAHDFLIRGWDKLQKWIKEEQGNVLLQRELTSTANRWISSKQEKRSGGFLWDDDPRLPLAKQLLERNDNWLNAIEIEFVQRSIRQRRDKRNRVIKITSGVSTALAGLTLFAFIQLQLSILREKAALAGNLLPTRRSVDGLVLAIEATGRSQSILKPLLQPVFNSTVQSQLMRAVQIARERNLMIGHSAPINSVVFSSNGKYIASTSEDGTIRLWNLQGEQVGEPFRGHDGGVNAVAFSPDSQLIVTGGNDSTIRLWNLRGQKIGKPFNAHKGDQAVTSVAFTANGQFIVSGGSDGTVRLWNKEGEQIQALYQSNKGRETCIDISQNGRYMVIGALGDGVQVFDFQNGSLSNPLPKHQGLIESVSISSDGQYVVSSNAFEVTLTDRKGNEVYDDLAKDFRPKLFQGDEGGIGSVKVSHDGEFIIASSQGIRLWDKQGQQVGQTLQGHLSLVSALAFSPDSQLIASGGIDGTVRVWDLQSLAVSKPFRGQADPEVSFSSTGKYIISRGYDLTLSTSTIQLINLQGDPIGKPLLGLDMSSDGDLILSDRDGTLRLWNLQGKAVSPGFPSDFYGFRFSPDGQFVVGNKDESLYLWDRQGHLVRKSRPFVNQALSAAVISPSNQFVVTRDGEYKTLRLWNIKGAPISQPFHGHEGRVIALAFSPDNQFIASGGEDRSIRLWDQQGRTIASPFVGHRNEVSVVAISSDSQLIASGSGVLLSRGTWFSADNTVRLWDKQGNPIGEPLQGHQGRVVSIAFSPDRQFMASSSNDDTVRIWQVGWQGWLEIACNRLQDHPVLRNPQTEEQRGARDTCEQYVWQDE